MLYRGITIQLFELLYISYISGPASNISCSVLGASSFYLLIVY